MAGHSAIALHSFRFSISVVLLQGDLKASIFSSTLKLVSGSHPFKAGQEVSLPCPASPWPALPWSTLLGLLVHAAYCEYASDLQDMHPSQHDHTCMNPMHAHTDTGFFFFFAGLVDSPAEATAEVRNLLVMPVGDALIWYQGQ